MVVCIFPQTEVSSNVESSEAVDIPFIVEVTGGGLRPVVRLEKLDLVLVNQTSGRHQTVLLPEHARHRANCYAQRPTAESE